VNTLSVRNGDQVDEGRGAIYFFKATEVANVLIYTSVLFSLLLGWYLFVYVKANTAMKSLHSFIIIHVVYDVFFCMGCYL